MKAINSSMLKNNAITLITILINNHKSEHFFKNQTILTNFHFSFVVRSPLT